MNRLAIACCLALAACGDDGAGVELTVLEPAATVELLPGGTIDVAWTVTGGEAELVVSVIPLNQDVEIVIYDETVSGDGGFAWGGDDVAGDPVPPDVYDLDFTLFVDGDPVQTELRNLSVHGVIITEPAAGETWVIRASEGEVDLRYTTVSQRVIMLTTLLDDLPIDERSIPGEFVPFARTVHFDGTDLTGAPIPAGQYTVTVHGWDADAPDLDYTRTGGIVDWRPLE